MGTKHQVDDWFRDEDLQEFITIWLDEFGETLTLEQARINADGIVADDGGKANSMSLGADCSTRTGSRPDSLSLFSESLENIWHQSLRKASQEAPNTYLSIVNQIFWAERQQILKSMVPISPAYRRFKFRKDVSANKS